MASDVSTDIVTENDREDRGTSRDPHAVKAMGPEELIEEFRPLVGSIVTRLRRQLRLTPELEDLESSGFLGLLEAQDRYDPELGYLFATFAYYRIRGKILDDCRRDAWSPRPREASRVQKLDRVLESNADVQRTSPRPTTLGEAIDRVAQLVDTAATVYLLEDIDQTVPVEAVQQDHVERTQANRLLNDALEQLPKSEREIVRRHYLEDERMEDIGKSMGRSASWVSRANRRALERLRRYMMGET